MVKCSFCGKKVDKPITCPYCGKLFCTEHGHLEKHNCNIEDKTTINNEEKIDSIVKEKPQKNEKNNKLHENQKKILLVSITITLFVLSGSWLFSTKQGANDGYLTGFDHGFSIGYEIGTITGYSTGYDLGSLTGYDSTYYHEYSIGYQTGNLTGFISGYENGNNTGYLRGKNKGLDDGYETGYTDSYPLGEYDGNKTGFTDGYAEGVYDIRKGSYNVTYPSYYEMKAFLRTDRTDRIRYSSNFVCHDYSVTLKRNAFEAGYYCYYVIVKTESVLSDHAIVAFNTTDRGLIFIEPQYDDVVELVVGKSYSKLNSYVRPIIRDVITGYTLVR